MSAKPVTLEPGGNAWVVVDEDAEAATKNLIPPTGETKDSGQGREGVRSPNFSLSPPMSRYNWIA